MFKVGDKVRLLEEEDLRNDVLLKFSDDDLCDLREYRRNQSRSNVGTIISTTFMKKGILVIEWDGGYYNSYPFKMIKLDTQFINSNINELEEL